MTRPSIACGHCATVLLIVCEYWSCYRLESNRDAELRARAQAFTADLASIPRRTRLMDWFETLTGFQETDYEDTRAKLSVEGSRLRSLVNGKDYGIGKLELVSL